MGPLPDHRVGPSLIFQSVAVDLFWPIEYQGTVNKRQVGKGWGVMFVCSATSAVHVEFMDTYSTDSFLMALRRFICARGVLSSIQSDKGEQHQSSWRPKASKESKNGPEKIALSGTWSPPVSSISTGKPREWLEY
jgi:hypothetical protein